MKTKEEQAKEYADRIPHYQDRKQHAAEDFLAGWEAAEGWRTDKENIPDRKTVIALYHNVPALLWGKEVRQHEKIKYWKPLLKLPKDESV